ncbi:hypothetical protein [Rubritalea tangerina]
MFRYLASAAAKLFQFQNFSSPSKLTTPLNQAFLDTRSITI